MNTRILLIVLVIIIAIGGAWFAFGRTMQAPVEEGVATTTPTAATEETGNAQTTTVTYSDQGYAPASVTVKVGDTVKFVNESGSDMWVGADDHPTHTSYDGTATREHCADGANTNGSFDQCARSGSGTTWSYTFTKAGTFKYHNHARASHGGTVVVE